MAWLARSIADSLRLDGEEEGSAAAVDEAREPVDNSTAGDAVLREDQPRDSALSIEDRRSDSEGGASDNHGADDDSDDDYDRRGVKEDLSELRESFTRQFWGVASFLAPPPPPPPPPPLIYRSNVQSKSDPAGSVNADEDEEEEKEEEGEEMLEYDERETGELGESADFSPSKDDDADILEDAVGVTEEVLAFARNIAHHPETWLDFPIEEDEFDGKET